MLAAVKPVVEVFEQPDITYLIGGSIASTVYEVARSNLDADFMTDVKPEHITGIVELLRADYYISENAIREAFAIFPSLLQPPQPQF